MKLFDANSIWLLVLVVLIFGNTLLLRWCKKQVLKKNKEIESLKDRLHTSKQSYHSTKDALSRSQQKLGEHITDFTNTSNILFRKNLYLTYLLKSVNQEWFKYLRVYDPEQSLPALKLSNKFEGHEHTHYGITDYKGKIGYADKTDFVIETANGERRLSKLITQLEVPVPENGVLPLLTELKTKYVK